MKQQPKGTLYGLGVGPGDPDLMTLKAVKVLKSVRVVFAARSSKNDHSIALDAARPHMPPDVRIKTLAFPMIREQDELEAAWAANAAEVLAELDTGEDAAFLTLGDPLTYSTFGYLLEAVRSRDPEVEIRTIPGITAYQAAAARLNLPLAQGEESLTVVPGVTDMERLRELAAGGDNLVVLKAYKNFGELRRTLSDLNLSEKAWLVSRLGLDGESFIQDLSTVNGRIPPYLSLLISKRGDI
jgi:precorrin-2/cobalt-factor-2 C20-methyltransferase